MTGWKKLFERDYTIQYWENACFMTGKTLSRLHLQPVENLAVYRYSDKNAAIFAPENEFNKHEKELRERFTQFKNARAFLNYFMKAGNAYLTAATKAGREKNDLENAYENYWRAWEEYTSMLWLAFELNEFFADDVRRIIEKRYSKTSPSLPLSLVLASALRPSKTAATVKIAHDAVEVKKNFSENRLEEFRREYEWFPCNDLKFTPMSLQAAREIVENATEVKPEKQIDVGKTLRFSEEEKDFLELAREYFYLKDLRDEFRRKGVFSVMPLYKTIARELGIAFSQAYSLLRQEILDGLAKGEADTSEADSRLEKHYVLLNTGRTANCWAGDSADEKAQAIGIKPEEARAGLKKISGIPAAAGVKRGKARIIRVAAHLNRVQKDEILVAVTTNPNYIQAMSMASAIVTDEGGLTSHAAIVSREMKKPCVVGTKIATKVLKDGDLIEVNGETGEIRVVQ